MNNVSNAIREVIRKFISEKPTHKLTLAEQNRKLLFDSLPLCRTKKDIEKIKDVLNHSADYLDGNQRISFTLELHLLERKIAFCKKRLQKEFYTPGEVFSLLKNTGKYYQCEAIAHHIEINIEIYRQYRSDLTIYKKMIDKRKEYLLNQCQVFL